MTYCTSDLHGQYEKFLKLLDKIGFSERDTLFVVGDVLDRGPDPIGLLEDLSMRHNVFPIMGNHDLAALSLLSLLDQPITKDNCESVLTGELLRGFALWRADGGETTLAGFRKRTPEEREALLDYLREFSYWEELSVGERRFVLVHGGLPDFRPDRPLADYPPRGLVSHRTDYAKRYFEQAILVTGHTPTALIHPSCEGRIYRENGHIALDTGAGFGGPVSAVCLETGEEYYVG